MCWLRLSPAPSSIWRRRSRFAPRSLRTRCLSRPCGCSRPRFGARSGADAFTGCSRCSCCGPICTVPSPWEWGSRSCTGSRNWWPVSRRAGSQAYVIRALGRFIVISPLTLLATPYGTAIIHYYRATLANPQFSRIVTEWKPVTSVPVLAVPLFALIVGTLYTFVRAFLRARAGRVKQVPLFDVLVLVAARGRCDRCRAQHHLVWAGGRDAAAGGDHEDAGRPEVTAAPRAREPHAGDRDDGDRRRWLRA